MNEYASPYHGMNLAGFNQTNRPNQVYPIYIEKETGVMKGVGKSLYQLLNEGEYVGEKADFEFDYSAPDGLVDVYPVTNKGDKCVWRLTPDGFVEDWKKGYIKIVPQVCKNNQNLFSVQYLADGITQKIESKEVDTYRISNREDIPTLEVEDFKTGGVNIPTIWTSKMYYTARGSSELTNIMGEKGKFPYPKPMQLVKDILQRISRPDSIILDSFGGSGTTAHAVLSLNQEDEGNRKFILIEMMEYADTITAERVKRVISGYSYKGEVKEEIYSKKLTPKNLSQGANIIEQAEKTIEENKDKYDKISKPKIADNCLKVIGTKVFEERMDGLGGSFDYYELGEPLFNEDGNLNEKVGIDKIRSYIYYTETHEPLVREQDTDYPYLMDYHDGTGYFFYYEADEITTLSHDTLNIVPKKAEHYVIYADVCAISREQLALLNITFKKIPRDINRF